MLTLEIWRSKSLKLLLSHHRHVEGTPLVCLLILAPPTVNLGQGSPVVVEPFVNLPEAVTDVRDLEFLVDPVNDEVEDEAEDRHEDQRPVGRGPALSSRDDIAQLVVCNRQVSLVHDRVKVIVRQKLLVREHNVTDKEVEEWSKAQSLGHELRHLLVVSRWLAVDVVHGVFLHPVEHLKRKGRDREKNGDTKSECKGYHDGD